MVSVYCRASSSETSPLIGFHRYVRHLLNTSSGKTTRARECESASFTCVENTIEKCITWADPEALESVSCRTEWKHDSKVPQLPPMGKGNRGCASASSQQHL